VELSKRILFIDDDAIVIDKPAGLPVDTPRRGGDSVVSRAAELRCGRRSDPVPMHRLDQDTSGCLLLARNARARRTLQRAFEAHEVRKSYLAVVGSPIQMEAGAIDLPLTKTSSADAGWRMIADAAGQSAMTNWRRIAVRDGRTLVEFTPVTGRTHQIRAHAREAFGSGIVGDRVYGIPGGAMLLHASRLVVPREDRKLIDVTAPLPDHFGEWRDAA
jgi:tRNA pseudouridine32 synthase/23S rRNA pseudouridine746 synthase